MTTQFEPGYYSVCCLACGTEQAVHSNAYWSMCTNRKCRIAMKINHAGTKQDLIDIEKVVRRLMHGDFVVIE